MKISFCIIVYNEAELIHQQLTNLYSHAHEIIVVIGRVLEFGDRFPKKADNTKAVAESFPDPEKKITVIHKETWGSKENMVATYYKAATGDYVWHVDSDEFYTDECIENTKRFIADTRWLNYAHQEYFYYRYYNVVIAKDSKIKFWNRPARIHKVDRNRRLTHRPQLIVGSKPHETLLVPPNVGIRHHYSIMSLDRANIKGNFYGHANHSRFYHTYSKPIEELIAGKVCVRPDCDKKDNSIPSVLTSAELEVPPGVSEIFAYYEHPLFPWTVSNKPKREESMNPLQASWSAISKVNAAHYLENYPDYNKKKLARYIKSRFDKVPRVLELGCGSLATYKVMKRIVTMNYTGVDFSSPLVRVAKAKFPEVTVINDENINYLKTYEGPKFDIVVLSHVMELMESQDLLLQLCTKITSLIGILWYEPPRHPFHVVELKPSAHPKDTISAPYLRILTAADYYEHLQKKHKLKIVYEVQNPEVSTDVLHVLETL